MMRSEPTASRNAHVAGAPSEALLLLAVGTELLDIGQQVVDIGILGKPGENHLRAGNLRVCACA